MLRAEAESWNSIVVYGVIVPKGGTWRVDEVLFGDGQALISCRSCWHVLERTFIVFSQFWMVERETVIVCGVRSTDEKIWWRSSRGRARRADDIEEASRFSRFSGAQVFSSGSR